MIPIACIALALGSQSGYAQQIALAFSSVDSPNANWYIAKERQLFKKYGLDADLVFIRSSTTTIAAVLAGSVSAGNISGGATANAAVSGASVVAVGCFINTLPYDLVVHESIRSAQQLKGKAIGISRVGSSSDVAARAFLKELKLEPDKDVAILQVGGSTERAVAFRTGRIIAFPAPQGTIHLGQGMPHRVLISMADFPQGLSVPLCLSDGIEKFCSTEPRHYEAAFDGAHRWRAFLQDPQG